MIAEPNKKKSPLLASEVKLLVAQSYLTLCNPMDYSPPGSSIQEILQARILEWVAIPFSRGSSPPRDQIPGIPARDLLHCKQIIYHQSYRGSPFPALRSKKEPKVRDRFISGLMHQGSHMSEAWSWTHTPPCAVVCVQDVVVFFPSSGGGGYQF